MHMLSPLYYVAGQKHFSLLWTQSCWGKGSGEKSDAELGPASHCYANPLHLGDGGPRSVRIEGNVNAATFQDFVTEELCPNIFPFNGVNPRSVVILGKKRWLTGKPSVP